MDRSARRQPNETECVLHARRTFDAMKDYLPEKGYQRILMIAVYLAFGAGALYLTLRYLLGALLPFLLALATVSVLRPFAKRIRAITGMNRRAAGVAALLAAFGVIGVLAAWGIHTLLTQAEELLRLLSENADSIAKDLSRLTDRLPDMLAPSGERRQAWQTAIREGLGRTVSGILDWLTSVLPHWIGGMLTSIPGALLFVLVYGISSFSLCMRYEETMGKLSSFLPPLGRRFLSAVKVQLAKLSLGYLRAAMVMLAVTFFELYFGLLLLGHPYALLLAFLISLVDLLPILGVGSILLPWAAVCLIEQKLRMGIGLLILFVVITVARQLLEPRVVGKTFGLSPLVTITAMYAGWYLFGAVGMLLFPAGLTLGVKCFSRQGLYGEQAERSKKNDRISEDGP